LPGASSAIVSAAKGHNIIAFYLISSPPTLPYHADQFPYQQPTPHTNTKLYCAGISPWCTNKRLSKYSHQNNTITLLLYRRRTHVFTILYKMINKYINNIIINHHNDYHIILFAYWICALNVIRVILWFRFTWKVKISIWIILFFIYLYWYKRQSAF
jgi:hypothetical protein